MDGHVFYQRVARHPELIYAGAIEGATPDGDFIAVVHVPSNRRTHLAVSAILTTPWEQLERVLTFQRAPRIISQITRVIGYFSMIHNWNRSAVAQLKDRHNGNYVVPEVAA